MLGGRERRSPLLNVLDGRRIALDLIVLLQNRRHRRLLHFLHDCEQPPQIMRRRIAAGRALFLERVKRVFIAATSDVAECCATAAASI